MSRAVPEPVATSTIDNEHPALRRALHPVCRSSDVADGQVIGTRLLGVDWAVARIDGEIVAMVDRCPHRLAPLSAGAVVDGTIECPYHGYRFEPDGRCVHIPALGPDAAIPPKATAVTPAAIEERYGLVWLAPEPPVTGIIDVPEWDDPEFVVAPLPDQQWRAGAGQLTENFLDQGHLAMLHAETFGDPDAHEVPTYTVERDGWSFVCSFEHSTKLLADSGGTADYTVANRRDTFVYEAPFSLRLRIEYLAEDVVLTICFFHQPVDRDTTRLYVFDLRNDIADGRTTVEEAVSFQMAVGAEDKAMLERFTTTATPIDLQAEVHTRADRNTVEMRRVLADLVALHVRAAASTG
ncbi:MAG: aromatic ring-hydroxylating dioxygenase subunit alpha [Actinomycetota bacterium]